MIKKQLKEKKKGKKEKGEIWSYKLNFNYDYLEWWYNALLDFDIIFIMDI